VNHRAAGSPDAQTFRPLSGRRLFLARLGWLVVFVVTIGLFSAIIPAYYDSLVSFSDPEHDTATVRANLEAAGVSIERFATYLLGISVASAVVWVVVGTLIFWRRSDNWIALFASLCLIVFGTFGLNESGVLALPDQDPALWLPVRLLALFSNVGVYTLVLIFPNGRFVPRWTRWAVVLFALHDVFFFLFPSSIFNLAESFPPLDFAVLATVACVAIGSQLYRYRHVSAPVERQQTKWVVFGMVSAGLGSLIFEVPISGSPLGQFGPLYALAIHAGLYGSLLLIPLSFGVAILRYRLWDVDAVINRTLVYGALSVIVVALYTLIVVALGELFQARADLAVSLVATGVVVVLFAPLRERLQRGANRLMYGERDDLYAVLSRLGRRLEATIVPKAVLETIVETIAQALKVPYAAINLRQDGAHFATAAEYGTPKGEPLILPLVYQRETVGHLIVASRAGGDLLPGGRAPARRPGPPGRGGGARRQAHPGPATLQGEAGHDPRGGAASVAPRFARWAGTHPRLPHPRPRHRMQVVRPGSERRRGAAPRAQGSDTGGHLGGEAPGLRPQASRSGRPGIASRYPTASSQPRPPGRGPSRRGIEMEQQRTRLLGGSLGGPTLAPCGGRGRLLPHRPGGHIQRHAPFRRRYLPR
jgi:hypothetical protein